METTEYTQRLEPGQEQEQEHEQEDEQEHEQEGREHGGDCFLFLCPTAVDQSACVSWSGILR